MLYEIQYDNDDVENEVLILILMEYALRVSSQQHRRSLGSLNPYSNGICSTRHYVICVMVSTDLVLILILMEYALRESLKLDERVAARRLNPYSNGICSTSSIYLIIHHYIKMS